MTAYESLLDGFLPGSGAAGGRGATKAAIGRPVDVLQMPDGAILISDDRGNRLIRVSKPVRYAAAGGPNQVVSASASPD